ncbi:MAG: preprotein translocase subunit YajC [Spirochaetota bacterium]
MFADIQDLGLFLLAAPPSGDGGGSSMTQTFIFMGLIFAVFWFFMIRPQKQKQKQREAMLKAVAKGDHVITIGGVRGTVSKVSDDTITIKVDDNCRISFSRSAIAEVVLDEQETARRSEALKSKDGGQEAKKQEAKKAKGLTQTKAVGEAQENKDKQEEEDKGEEDKSV